MNRCPVETRRTLGQARASANAVSADGTSPLLCAVRADVAPLQAGVVKRWEKHVGDSEHIETHFIGFHRDAYM